MKKIVVDRDRCTGIGVCESIAPGVFEVNDDGSLLVFAEHIGDGEAVEEAVRACPAAALLLVDEDTE